MPKVTGVLDTFSRFVKVLAVGLFLYPAGIVASLYLTWFTAWAVLGHTPRPSLDDPKYISLLVDIPYIAAMGFLNCAPGAFVLGCGLIPTVATRQADSVWSKIRVGFVALGCFVLCWGAAMFFLRADPWEVGNWYMD